MSFLHGLCLLLIGLKLAGIGFVPTLSWYLILSPLWLDAAIKALVKLMNRDE